MSEDRLCIWCSVRKICRLNETLRTRDFFEFFMDNLTSNMAKICRMYKKSEGKKDES